MLIAVLATALTGCSDRSPAPPGRTVDAGPADTAPTRDDAVRRWSADTLEPGFRTFAWGDGDTLVGIFRGRLAFAANGRVTRLAQTVWDVHAAAGVVSWTDESGFHVRDWSGTRVVPRPDFISDDHTGPAVLWSADGSRALLTWQSEAGTRHSLLRADAHTEFSARIAGYSGGEPALWLDSTRVLLVTTAYAPRSGSGSHREGGYRSNVAILDIARDTMYLVTSSADGEFTVVEGFLGPDSILIGVRSDGVPSRHLAVDTAGWRATTRLQLAGLATARVGVIALLTPLDDDGPERSWELSLIERDVRQVVDTVAGHAVRLLWHPSTPMLAVSLDSEQPQGYRTILLRLR